MEFKDASQRLENLLKLNEMEKTLFVRSSQSLFNLDNLVCVLVHKGLTGWDFVHSPQTWDLDPISFLKEIAGQPIKDDEETILYTPQSWKMRKVLTSQWIDILFFCDDVYESLFDERAFVQESDYIMIFPRLKKICVANHNFMYAQIDLSTL